MNGKRCIKSTQEILERQNLKMLFLLEELQDEMEKLSPGKTAGKPGEQVAVRLSYMTLATSYMRKAQQLCELSLKTYEK